VARQAGRSAGRAWAWRTLKSQAITMDARLACLFLLPTRNTVMGAVPTTVGREHGECGPIYRR
jgi:hypothetical protein